MGEKIGKIDSVKYDQNHSIQTEYSDEKKIKQTSIFAPQVAFVPQGGIGQILNGTQQSDQAAFSA